MFCKRQRWNATWADLLVLALNAVLVSADTFGEIELWAREKLDWLRGYAPQAMGAAKLSR